MRRFSATGTLAVSASAGQNTYPVGFITGASRVLQVYELVCGMNAAVLDAQVIVEVNGSSVLITAGAGITPTPIDSGSSPSAAITACSQAPTGATPSPANPFLRIPFNSRSTVRWAAIDPDSRIIFPAGGAAAGSCVITNRQPGTTASITLDTTVLFAE